MLIIVVIPHNVMKFITDRSVGVMAYVLLTGFTPFGGDTDQETFQNICHGQLDFPDELFEDISPQAEDFIRKTLTREPR